MELPLYEIEGTGNEEPTARTQPLVEVADLDNILDALIELLNAGDYSELESLFAAEVHAPFLGAATGGDTVEGLGDLLLRNPGLLMTRGDLDVDPIVVAWKYDPDAERYELAGYLTVSLNEEALIEQLDFVDEFDDPDALVVEEPDDSELAEWDDWSELDEG